MNDPWEPSYEFKKKKEEMIILCQEASCFPLKRRHSLGGGGGEEEVRKFWEFIIVTSICLLGVIRMSPTPIFSSTSVHLVSLSQASLEKNHRLLSLAVLQRTPQRDGQHPGR